MFFDFLDSVFVVGQSVNDEGLFLTIGFQLGDELIHGIEEFVFGG